MTANNEKVPVFAPASASPFRRSRRGPGEANSQRGKVIGDESDGITLFVADCSTVPPTYLRRAITIPALFLGTLVLTVLSPVLLGLAAVVDLITGPRRFRNLRTGIFLIWLAWIETIAVFVAAIVWLRHLGRMHGAETQRRLQRIVALYGHRILGATSRSLGLRIEATGAECLSDGAPVLIFGHHTSLLDSVIPVEIAGYGHDYSLHYVIKKSLAWGPAFDVVGHWARIHFVDRTGKDSEREMDSIAALGLNLQKRQAPVIYPEGTFYNKKRLARAVERLREQAPELVSRAERLRHVLPPRTGGATALLDAAPDADVVFVVHAGFERFTTIGRIFRSIPFRHPVPVNVWRVPRRDVPTEPQERYRWLFDNFERMDRWVIEQLEPLQTKAA